MVVEILQGIWALQLSIIINKVKVSFPFLVKNLTRFCHKRRKPVKIVVDSPWFVQEGYFPKYHKNFLSTPLSSKPLPTARANSTL